MKETFKEKEKYVEKTNVKENKSGSSNRNKRTLSETVWSVNDIGMIALTGNGL